MIFYKKTEREKREELQQARLVRHRLELKLRQHFIEKRQPFEERFMGVSFDFAQPLAVDDFWLVTYAAVTVNGSKFFTEPVAKTLGTESIGRELRLARGRAQRNLSKKK
ncbi:MAG TPA: hypothetical protein V6C81_12430 [Planktothrix sp.]